AAGQTPPGGAAGQTPPGGAAGQTPPGGAAGQTPPSGAAGQTPPGGPGGQAGGLIGQRAAPPPPNTAPIPAAPPSSPQAMTPIAPGTAPQGPRHLDDFRGQRREVREGGRTIITEPGRIIVREAGGQQFVRHDEMERFRYGARDIRTERVGRDTRTVVIRPDGSEIITVNGPDGLLLRRIRRDQQGREVIIIDNTYRDPSAIGGFYVDLPPPIIRMPMNRYIVEADEAPPDVIYDTLEAPPVDRVERRYSLDEIRYSPSVRQLMPSIDLNTINFDTGSWEIPPD